MLPTIPSRTPGGTASPIALAPTRPGRHDTVAAPSKGVGDVAEPRNFLSLLTGSFSTPAADNPTVAMIEAAYRHHGIDARYLNCDVAREDLGDAVRGARAMGW